MAMVMGSRTDLGQGQPHDYLPSAPHHVWAALASDGAPEHNEMLDVVFDPISVDFVARLPTKTGEAICQFELPHLCERRPHEDPLVEAWLMQWLDGIGPEVEEAVAQGVEEPHLKLSASILFNLQALAAEVPEVCPILRGQLNRFEEGLARRLWNWPPGEPAREGITTASRVGVGLPTATSLELELYVGLDFVRHRIPPGAAALANPRLIGDFQQIACGWIFKLESLYGLSLVEQPERVIAASSAAGVRLSLLSWDLSTVTQLLLCPFFRPEEQSLLSFARRWWSANAGQLTLGAHADFTNVFSEVLLWELLPPVADMGAMPSTVLNSSVPFADQDNARSKIEARGSAIRSSVGSVRSSFAGGARMQQSTDSSRMEDVHASEFRMYTQSLAKTLSKGCPDAEQAVVSFMDMYGSALEDNGTVASNFVPFELVSGSSSSSQPACVVIDITLRRFGDAFEVCHKSELSSSPIARRSVTNTEGVDVGEASWQAGVDVLCVPGYCFEQVPRGTDCPLTQLAGVPDSSSFHINRLASGAHVWNSAAEVEVVGAARQMLAATIPMCGAVGSSEYRKFRFDFRVLGGIEAESAHLFEVGLVANPKAGVHFKVHGPGASRPEPGARALGMSTDSVPSPFFQFAAVSSTVVEGVRLVVEVDFDAEVVSVRNLPPADDADRNSIVPPTPMSSWLEARARLCAAQARPPGELDDVMFRDQAKHLHEMIAQGTFPAELTNTVLNDRGAQCVRGACVPDVPEEYHFYVVIPAGMDVELF